MPSSHSFAGSRWRRSIATGALLGAIASVILNPAPCVASDQPAVPRNPFKDAYFGEQHLHTAYSLDAYIGGARLTPFDAYRFAKGEDVSVNNVLRNIGRKLDFVAVSDHAEFLGEMLSAQVPTAPGHYQPCCGGDRRLQVGTRTRGGSHP